MQTPPSSLPHRGFTLIELLVVMAVMLVLMALLVPAFTGIGRGHALKAGGDSVANLAMLGRQNSLTKNAMTALIMIGDPTRADNHRSFGLFELVPREDGTEVESFDWRQLGQWETLPDGIVADFCGFTESSTPMLPPFPILMCKGSKVDRFSYLVFLPSGRLFRDDYISQPAGGASTAGVAHVRVVQGFFASSGTVTYTSAKTGAGQPANFYDLSIISATGRLKIDRPS
jgi:prepilin-type N-terminal cleavage/methylation domain-containing protein